MTPYARNLVTAMRASEVMLALVELERITCRNGWSSDGVSKVLTSTHMPWHES
jgi:hypothetical protein